MSEEEAFMGLVVRGSPEALGKLKRMIEGFIDVDLLYLRISRRRLWVTSHRPVRRQAPPPQEEVVEMCGGQEFFVSELRQVEEEWVRAGIIR